MSLFQQLTIPLPGKSYALVSQITKKSLSDGVSMWLGECAIISNNHVYVNTK